MKIYIAAVALFVLGACSTAKKTTSTPATAAITDALPAMPSSDINLPIKIYAPPLLSKLDSMVPLQFTSDGWPNYLQAACDFRYKYRFVRSGLQVTCINNKITVKFTGNYQVAGSRAVCAYGKVVSPWVSGSCGFGDELMRRVTIAISSQLSFTPDYHIHSVTKLEQLQALDKCQVSIFSNDVTQQIVDSIKSSVNGFCGLLDQTIANMNFSSLVNLAADKSYHKTDLGKYGYFVLNPSSVRMGALNLVKDSFAVVVGLSCYPALSSDSSNAVGHAVFPPLSTKITNSGASVYMDANYSYAFLSKLITDTLHNQVFEVKGRTIVIKSISLRSNGNRQLEMRVDFSGSNHGSITLRGTPVLDTAKQSITVNNLSYSIEDEDLALKIAKSLFRNKIKKTLQGKSYLDVGAVVKASLPAIDSMLNRQSIRNLSFAGKTHDIRLAGFLAGDNSLQVRVYLSADVAVLSSGAL